MRCDLQGKVSLVTGAARGIGQAIAEALMDNGSTVVFTDVDEAAVVESAGRVTGAHAKSLDVTNPRQIEDVLDWTLAKFGRLDIVVNNAGVNTLVHRVTIDS